MNETTPIQRTAEIARRLAALGEQKGALDAYILLIHQLQKQNPELELEAALYIFHNGGDYKVPYSSFCSLYNRGLCHEELFSLLTQAFYLPNVKAQKARYEKNCKLLEKYPYLFRKDFPKFEELPLLFFPYDDRGFLTYDPKEDRFGPYIDYSHEVVSRNFFADLEKPILAADVFSQYELEYLNDNVRKSEWVARENHIYLHYTDWAVFCAHLQVLNLRQLLKDKKFVFLMEGEIEQYPIDFKARFNIDYSKYPVKPITSDEFHRLIWHTQLATHNGGDFFNEVFDHHPNLVALPSVMLEDMHRLLNEAKADNPTMPDNALLAACMMLTTVTSHIDPRERIVPALFVQPHFPNINYTLNIYAKNMVTLHSNQYEELRNSPIFKAFKYIKTFTPIRRVTTSCAASVRFMNYSAGYIDEDQDMVYTMGDNLSQRLLNRSYMIDPQDRLFKDSVMVRFEDAKLNPTATFKALAAFLDLPYTESMSCCSYNGVPLNQEFNGFSTHAVYRTYDDYLGMPERYYLEYFLQDLYKYCGYDLQYYDGKPMDMERANDFLGQFTVMDKYILDSWQTFYRYDAKKIAAKEIDLSSVVDEDIDVSVMLEQYKTALKENRQKIAEALLENPTFVSPNGQLLHMMPMLQLDPDLLEQPLYH